MKNYVLSILASGVFSAIALYLSPKRGGLQKFIAFIGALCTALCILYPICGGLPVIDVLFDTEAEQLVESAENNAEYTARNIARAVSQITNIDIREIYVTVETDQSGNVINADVSLPYTSSKTRKTEKQLSNVFNCKITINAEGDAK